MSATLLKTLATSHFGPWLAADHCPPFHRTRTVARIEREEAAWMNKEVK
jgi:hypothetical protein